MTIPNYSPYCGRESGCKFNYPRTEWNGNQFECKCGFVTGFTDDFIKRYKEKWNK